MGWFGGIGRGCGGASGDGGADVDDGGEGMGGGERVADVGGDVGQREQLLGEGSGVEGVAEQAELWR